jgi:hypothetical protein
MDNISIAEKIATLRRLEQNSQDSREVLVLTEILRELYKISERLDQN